MSRSVRSAVAVMQILGLSTCSESPTGPEAPSATPIGLHQLVAGSVTAGGSVTYSVAAPVGTPILIALQARTGSVADTMVATVSLTTRDVVLATVRSAGTQANLRDGTVSLPADAEPRTLLITVTGATPSTAGEFDLKVGSIGDAPEWNTAALPRETIAVESIDGAGDVDEFTVQATEGHLAVLQLAADVPFSDGLIVELLDGTAVLSSVTATASQAQFEESAPAWSTFPRTGPFTVRVRVGSLTSSQKGGYRLRLSSFPSAPPPRRIGLWERYVVVDTIAGADSVVAWQVEWSSPTKPIAFALEVLSSEPGDTLTATLSDESGGLKWGSVRAVANGGGVLLTVPTSIGTAPYPLIAVVRGLRPGAQAVYRVRFGSPLSDAPESVPAALALGDTVTGETIGDPREMDRFIVTPGPADTAFVVMLVPISQSTELGVRIDDRDHRRVAEWGVTGFYTDLERTATRFSLPPGGGPFEVTVGAIFTRPPSYSGGYKLRVVRVDRTPEGTPVPVTPGQTISGVIEEPGDIDEIQLDVVEGDELYFHHRVAAAPSDGQNFGLWDGTTRMETRPLPGYALPLDQQRVHHRWIAPRTGSFVMRVQNGQVSGPRSDYPAPYSIEVQQVSVEPESLPGTGWVYGDTIVGESIERRGDVDEFFMTFDSPQMTRLVLVAQRTGVEGGIHLTVEGPGGIGIAEQNVAAPSASDTISVGPHVEFPVAGTYRFRLEGTSLSPIPYRVFLVPSYVGPEVIGDTLPVGPWITGEAIDSIGDIDRYVFPVEPGRRYVAQIEMLPGATGAVSFESGLISARSDGTVTFGRPTTAEYLRATVEWFPSLAGLAQGPYRMRIQYSTAQPETASPTIAIGDTIDTESLEILGDEDTFTFTATAGELLRLRAVSGAQAADALLVLRLVEVGGDSDFVVDVAEGTLEFTPAYTGTFRVVVQQHMPLIDRDLGPYSLSLVRR